MACNCKRKIELEDKYGIEEEETILQKLNRFFIKVIFMVLAIGVTVVVAPILVIMSFYKVFFGNGKITLPNFLSKYLKNTDGQELQNTH